MAHDEMTWDIFGGLHMMESTDHGQSWTRPEAQQGLTPWQNGRESVVISDFTSQWHRASGQFLGLGHTCRYRDGALMPQPRPRSTVWSTLAPASSQWAPASLLEMPDPEAYFCAGAGSIQWVEREDGRLLIPIYYKSRAASYSPEPGFVAVTEVAVMLCRLSAGQLTLEALGTPLRLPRDRGLGEPSLVKGEDRYWLTLRNGKAAYLSTSYDGLHYTPPEPWRFDDGELLGSHDTQTHWAQIGQRLFLVYTRKAEDNAFVVRYRAPLFMAELDESRGVLLRRSERIVVPNRGALLGNFGVTRLDDTSAVICASEWMENAGQWNPTVWNALHERFPAADLSALAATPGRCGLCELGGSDNSIHLVTAYAP